MRKVVFLVNTLFLASLLLITLCCCNCSFSPRSEL